MIKEKSDIDRENRLKQRKENTNRQIEMAWLSKAEVPFYHSYLLLLSQK